jgi:hypothetical protein
LQVGNTPESKHQTEDPPANSVKNRVREAQLSAANLEPRG